MPFGGGELVKSKNVGKGGTVISAHDNLAFWMARNRASPRPHTRVFGKAPRLVEMLDFPPLAGGAPVRYLEIQNWGHRWPRWEASAEEGIEAFDIADVIYDFFADLVLPTERLEEPEPVLVEA